MFKNLEGKRIPDVTFRTRHNDRRSGFFQRGNIYHRITGRTTGPLSRILVGYPQALSASYAPKLNSHGHDMAKAHYSIR